MSHRKNMEMMIRQVESVFDEPISSKETERFLSQKVEVEKILGEKIDLNKIEKALIIIVFDK